VYCLSEFDWLIFLNLIGLKNGIYILFLYTRKSVFLHDAEKLITFQIIALFPWFFLYNTGKWCRIFPESLMNKTEVVKKLFTKNLSTWPEKMKKAT